MGFGNFSSRGETDMILRNATSGGVEVYDIAGTSIPAPNDVVDSAGQGDRALQGSGNLGFGLPREKILDLVHLHVRLYPDNRRASN